MSNVKDKPDSSPTLSGSLNISSKIPIVNTNFSLLSAEQESLTTKISKEEVNYIELNQVLGEKFEDNYIVLERISKGSYSLVYCLSRQITGRNYVLKRFFNKHDGIYEIWIFNKIPPHTNILKYKEYYIYSKSMFIIFDYFPRTLKQYIEIFYNNNILMSKNMIQKYMKQLILATIHCHTNFILHNDLKTENILTDYHGNLMIIDFGVSIHMDGNKRYKTSCVSPWYRSPEAFINDTVEKIDKKLYYNYSTDVWSIGCIFIEMLIGKPAFIAEKENQIYGKILDTLKNLDKLLRSDNILKLSDIEIDLITKFLNLNPEKRISLENSLEHKYFK
jgi:serine/threonine protein kinase